MVDVLRHLHTYVPRSSNQKDRSYHEIGVVWDQLTVERAVNCQLAVTNGFTQDDRLEGMHAEIADWHAEMNFLGVSFSFHEH